MIKKFSIVLGILFVMLAAFGSIPNNIIGRRGLFVTDFAYNYFHFILGLLFLYVGLYYTNKLYFLIRISGLLFIFLAVVGSWSTGIDAGDVLVYGVTNGVGHIVYLFFGVVLTVIGTSNLRSNND